MLKAVRQITGTISTRVWIVLLLKWVLLVWLNAAYSFCVVVKYNGPADIAGTVCGVFTFVLI